MGIKEARPQYALSLLSTIKRGGRAELARAEPSDTELRTRREEQLCESSLRRPRIWILTRIGILDYRRSRSCESSRLRSARVFETGAKRKTPRRKRERRIRVTLNERIGILQTRTVFTSPEGIRRSYVTLSWIHRLNLLERKSRRYRSAIDRMSVFGRVSIVCFMFDASCFIVNVPRR